MELPPWKIQRVRTAGKIHGLGRERVVVELVEVAAVGEFLARPDTPEAFDELSAPPAERLSRLRDWR